MLKTIIWVFSLNNNVPLQSVLDPIELIYDLKNQTVFLIAEWVQHKTEKLRACWPGFESKAFCETLS